MHGGAATVLCDWHYGVALWWSIHAIVSEACRELQVAEAHYYAPSSHCRHHTGQPSPLPSVSDASMSVL
jgi:hypothetical protein